jgi:hypothetical protein
MAIAFDDSIPARGPELFIKRLKGGESRMYTVLGTQIRGIWVHWNPTSSQSEPHHHDNCPACKKEMPKRWKGFLHCWDDASHQEIFLELTPTSASAVMTAILGDNLLRGTVMTVSRGPKANSRLNVHVQVYRRDEKALPREKDPRLSILKLWGCDADGMEQLKEGPDGELIPFTLDKEVS